MAATSYWIAARYYGVEVPELKRVNADLMLPQLWQGAYDIRSSGLRACSHVDVGIQKAGQPSPSPVGLQENSCCRGGRYRALMVTVSFGARTLVRWLIRP